MNIKYLSSAVFLSVGLFYSCHVVAEVDQQEKNTPVEITITAPDPVEKKFTPNVNVPLTNELQAFAHEQAEINGVPYPIVLAVMEQESRFNIHADGGDSYGIMQINEIHGQRDIIIQPKENIKIGCWLLGYLYREYQNWDKALTAYNAGEQGAYELYFRHGYNTSLYAKEVLTRAEKFAQMR